MRRRTVGVLGILIGLAHVGTAQTTPTIPGDREATEQLAKIVETTKQNGLPVEPILLRVQYGLNVVHAPPALVIAKARDVASRLPIARDALSPDATPLDIAAGEVALSNHATPESLRAIRVALGNQPLAVPLGVLAQLVASGVSPKRATQTVIDFVKRGASAEQIATLGNEVTSDVALGARGMAALETRAQGLTAILGRQGLNGDLVTVPAASLPVGPKKP